MNACALGHLRVQLERFAPWILSLAAGGLWFWSGCDISSTFIKELLGTIVSAAAISAGFLTTALSILLPMGSTETGRKLRDSGLLPSLHCFLRSGIHSCLALAGFSIACFIFLSPDSEPVGSYWSTLLIALITHSASSLIRIAEILLNLFDRMSHPEDQNG